MPDYYVYYADGSLKGLHTLTLEQLTAIKILNPTRDYELVRRPELPAPLEHIHAGLGAFVGPAGIGRAVVSAISTALTIPHAWSGGYDPTVQTIHGAPIYEFSSELPNAFVEDADYLIGDKVSSGGKAYIAIANHNADDVPGSLPESWTEIPQRAFKNNAFPLIEEGLQGAIYVNSTALLPDATVAQFTAAFDADTLFSVGVGFAVNAHNFETKLSAIVQGVLVKISKVSDTVIEIDVKKANGTFLNFNESTWSLFNGATKNQARLYCPVSALNAGTEHTFKIVSNKGRLVVSIDNVKFGEFEYPDATYPLRKHVTGDKIGEVEGHLGKHYYTLQSLSGTQFDLLDLCFHKLNVGDISVNYSPIKNPHVIQNLNTDSDGELTYKAKKISFLAPPDNNDDSNSIYFFMGWRSLNDSWLVRRQARTTGVGENATQGAVDFNTDWENRATLAYS